MQAVIILACRVQRSLYGRDRPLAVILPLTHEPTRRGGGKRPVVTGHRFGRAVEPSEKTAAFVQGVEIIGIERDSRAHSIRQDCAHELQRLDISSLLMTDETEQMPCVALTRLARKNVAKNALGLGELSALPQGQRLLDWAQRPLARSRYRFGCVHDRRAPRRATPISS